VGSVCVCVDRDESMHVYISACVGTALSTILNNLGR